MTPQRLHRGFLRKTQSLGAVLLLALLLFAVAPATSGQTADVGTEALLVDAIDNNASVINITSNITLTAALPAIDSTVTINGGGNTLSGNDLYRIFELTSGGNLTINNLTMTKGYITDDNGGAIHCQSATLEVNNSAINHSRAPFDPDSSIFESRGGGIYANACAVTVSGSQLHDNFSGFDGFAIYATGGSLTVSNSNFYNNSSNSYDGTINVENGNLSVSGSAIYNNTAGSSEAGIEFAAAAGSNTFSLSNSVIRNNTGRAMWFGSSSTATATISDSAIDGNTRGIEFRGGIIEMTNVSIIDNGDRDPGINAHLFNHTLLNLTLTHVTIANNIARYEQAGGLDINDDANTTVKLRNSIIAGNMFGQESNRQVGDCTGTLNEITNSLIQDGSCSATLTGDPLFGAKVGAGTSSPAYYPLGANSPALEAGSQAHCAATDQAGNARPRPAGTICDIGAFESNLRPPGAITAAFSCFQTPDSLQMACQSSSTAGAIHLWVISDSGRNEVARIQATTPSQRSILEQMPAYGTYTVKLTVSDTNGLSHFTTLSIALTRSTDSRIVVSSRGSGGSGSAYQAPPAATPTPQPRVHTGELLLAQGYGLSATHGLRSGVQFRRLDATGVGIGWVIDMGFLDALDVWGYVEQGVEICFPPERGSGGLMFLDAATSPRTASPLASELRNGYTCASINRPGTVVLVRNAPQPSQLPMPTALPTTMLSGCMVRTINVLNFRDAPAGNVVEPLIPFNVTLTALERTDSWFRVDYHGARGWISADFVEPQGDCG